MPAIIGFFIIGGVFLIVGKVFEHAGIWAWLLVGLMGGGYWIYSQSNAPDGVSSVDVEDVKATGKPEAEEDDYAPVDTSPKPWHLRGIEEDDGNPAVFLTVYKRRDEDGVIMPYRITFEERLPDGSRQMLSDHEAGQWPLSWDRDRAEGHAYKNGISAYGVDLVDGELQ